MIAAIASIVAGKSSVAVGMGVAVGRGVSVGNSVAVGALSVAAIIALTVAGKLGVSVGNGVAVGRGVSVGNGVAVESALVAAIVPIGAGVTLAGLGGAAQPANASAIAASAHSRKGRAAIRKLRMAAGKALPIITMRAPCCGMRSVGSAGARFAAFAVQEIGKTFLNEQSIETVGAAADFVLELRADVIPRAQRAASRTSVTNNNACQPQLQASVPVLRRA